MSTSTIDQWWDDTVVANPFLWDETVMGIDWGESVNAWAVVGYKGKVLDQGFVGETPRGVDALLVALRRFAHPATGDLPRVAIETPRRLLVSALTQAGVTVVPLNPKSVKTARGLKNGRNQSKTDPKDAILIANVLRNNPTYYRALHGSTEEARSITLLYRAREQAVHAAVRQAAIVRSALAEYHPNALAAFSTEQLAENLAAYWVLLDALTPAQGARLRADGIATRMMKPGGRGSAKGVDKAAERIRDALRAPSLSYPPEFEAAFAETVRTNLDVLRAMIEHRVITEKRLSKAVLAHPFWDLLSPAKGAGETVIAGLIAEMGDDPLRFADANALMAYAGSAPAIDQSGNRSSVHRRDVKGNRLHQALWFWAGSVKDHEPGATVYYWTMRSRGAAHSHALRKIMNKLLRGVHTCVTNGVVWDDTLMWPTTHSQEYIDTLKADTKAALADSKRNRRKVAGMSA